MMTKMNKYGMSDLSNAERDFIRVNKDDYMELNEKLSFSLADFRKKKVARIKGFMCDLFRFHHPTKLAEADSIMLKYKDREDELVEALMSKYDVDEHGNHLHTVENDD
jgi:hypothetical protein